MSPELESFLRSAQFGHLRRDAYIYHGEKCSVCGIESGLDISFLTFPRPITSATVNHVVPLCKNCRGNYLKDLRKGLPPSEPTIEKLGTQKPVYQPKKEWITKRN